MAVLRRFSYGCEGDRIEDKIIELMISAEVLSRAGAVVRNGKHIA